MDCDDSINVGIVVLEFTKLPDIFKSIAVETLVSHRLLVQKIGIILLSYSLYFIFIIFLIRFAILSLGIIFLLLSITFLIFLFLDGEVLLEGDLLLERSLSVARFFLINAIFSISTNNIFLTPATLIFVNILLILFNTKFNAYSKS